MSAPSGGSGKTRERILIDQVVMWVRGGVLFVKGRFILTPEVLRFIPDGFLDKLAGAEPFERRLDSIENLVVERKDLIVRCAGEELKFHGPTVRVVGERLGAVLIERQEAGGGTASQVSSGTEAQANSVAGGERPPTNPGSRPITDGGLKAVSSQGAFGAGAPGASWAQTDSMPALRPPMNPGRSFLKGERVLVSGVVEVHVSALLSVKGNITLTDRRLRFSIESRLDRLVGKDAEFEWTVKEVEDIEFSSLRKILKVVTKDRSVTLQGTLTARLHSQFMALGIGREVEHDETASQLLETWEVQHFRGPLAHPGHLVIGQRHLTFTPSGALDSIVGAKVIGLNIDRITRVAIHGARDRRIHIFEGRTDFAFGVDGIGSRISSLANILLHTVPPGSPEVHPEKGWSGEKAEEILAGVDMDHLLDDDEDPLVLGSGLHWVGAGSFRRVWCVLTKNRILMLPFGGKGRRFEALLDGLRRGKDRENPSDLGFFYRGSYVRFTSRSGKPFTDAFWSVVEELLGSEVATAAAPGQVFFAKQAPARRRSADLPQNLGRLKRVTLSRGDWNVATFHDAATMEYPRGVGLVYKGVPSQDLHEGVELEVELARDDGLYRFTSVLVEVRDVKEVQKAGPFGGEGLAKTQSRFLLGLDNPDDVEFINRREGVRVRYGMRGTLRNARETTDGGLQADGRGFAVEIGQISIVGGTVLTDKPLRVGAVISIEVPLRVGSLELFGRVIRVDEPNVEEKRSLHRSALSFLELKSDDVDRLSSTVMLVQRENRPLHG